MSGLILWLYSGSALAAFLMIYAANGKPGLITLPAVLAWPIAWPLMFLIALFRYYRSVS